MGGVPTGRGCDACRKQKKKCHIDTSNPTCSRCARLGIECVGAGKQRYMFKVEYKSSLAQKQLSKRGRSIQQKLTTSNDAVELTATTSSVTAPPSNHLTVLAQALAAAMALETDLRYHLSWAYGAYLTMVPCRLGINEALDTAVDALVTTHVGFSCSREISVESLAKYSRALGALRKCLDNPDQAAASETLCAVSLLLVIQSMQTPLEHQRTGHAEGAAKILKARKCITPKDDFESLLLLSLRGPVLFEGLFNPNISLAIDEWKDLVENELDSNIPEGRMLQCLVRVPDILHQARNIQNKESGLLHLQAELRALYTTSRDICNQFRSRLLEIETPGALHTVAARASLKLPPIMLHAHYQRTYGFSLIIALYFNYILVAMHASGSESNFKPDATYLAHEMLSIAENAVAYRPLGAAFVPLGLLAARMAVGLDEYNQALVGELQRWYLDYQADFNGKGHGQAELKEIFGQLRLLEI